jgi:hypothetical protein
MVGWVAAAEHLNARGLAAAVPGCVVPLLRRRGLVVWAAGVAVEHGPAAAGGGPGRLRPLRGLVAAVPGCRVPAARRAA